MRAITSSFVLQALKSSAPVARVVVGGARISAAAVASVAVKQHHRLFGTSSSSDDHSPTNPLPFTALPFNSIQLDVENMDIDDTAEFGTRLWSTVAAAREKGTNAVWLKVPMLFSHFIPVAGLYGFKYHHAEGEVATLLLWLPLSDCKVPPIATHHVGVGGMVVVPSSSGDPGDSKILVVKETNKVGGLKLPGGYANLGEDLGVAAAREVWEETGIKSVFQEVLTVRHSHNIQFGRSDIYVICKMALADSTGAAAGAGGKGMEIKIDGNEIEEAQWITLRDYRAHTAHPMLQTVADMLLAGSAGLTEKTMPSPVKGRREFKLYHPLF